MKSPVRVTVATGKKSDTARKLTGVPVLFDDLHAEVDSTVLRSDLFDVLIGRPTIKRVDSVLEFPAEVVRLR